MRLLMSVLAVSCVALALSATPAFAKEHKDKKDHKHPATAPASQPTDKHKHHGDSDHGAAMHEDAK